MDNIYRQPLTYTGPLCLWVYMFQILLVKFADSADEEVDSINTNGTSFHKERNETKIIDSPVDNTSNMIATWKFAIAASVLLTVASFTVFVQFPRLKKLLCKGNQKRKTRVIRRTQIQLQPPSYISAEPPAYTERYEMIIENSLPVIHNVTVPKQLDVAQLPDVAQLVLVPPPMYETTQNSITFSNTTNTSSESHNHIRTDIQTQSLGQTIFSETEQPDLPPPYTERSSENLQS